MGGGICVERGIRRALDVGPVRYHPTDDRVAVGDSGTVHGPAKDHQIMTTDITMLAAAPAATNLAQDILIVTCHPPLRIGFVIWAVCSSVMPLVCTLSFIRYWRLAYRGQESHWSPRIISLAAFIVAVASTVEIISRVQYLLYVSGTTVWGKAQQAMASISLSHVCTVLSLGVLSSAVCCGFRLMLPPIAKTQDRHPTAPRDGVPAVHGP